MISEYVHCARCSNQYVHLNFGQNCDDVNSTWKVWFDQFRRIKMLINVLVALAELLSNRFEFNIRGNCCQHEINISINVYLITFCLNQFHLYLKFLFCQTFFELFVHMNYVNFGLWARYLKLKLREIHRENTETTMVNFVFLPILFHCIIYYWN